MQLNRERMELAMARRGMTQKDLSKAAGVSQNTISSVLWGRGIRPDTMNRICRALEVDPAELSETEGQG